MRKSSRIQAQHKDGRRKKYVDQEATSDNEDEYTTVEEDDSLGVSDRDSAIKKRAKINYNPRKRIAGTLRKFVEMPLEIVFTITSFLPPSTIVALTRVNRNFRNTLLSANNAIMWKNLRAEFDYPEPATNFTEQSWALFLFGDSGCQLCSRKHRDQVFIHFRFRMRLCTSCVKNSRFFLENTSPECSKLLFGISGLHSIHQIVMCGAEKPRRYTPSLWGFWFRRDDLQSIVNAFERRNSRRPWEEYLKELKAKVTTQTKHFEICEKWAHSLRAAERKSVVEERVNEIRRRLIDMGYTADDLVDIRTAADVTKPARLSEKSWDITQANILDTIRETRLGRLACDTGGVFYSRRLMVKDAYIEFLRTLPPMQWRELPTPDVIHLFSPINPLLVETLDGENLSQEQIRTSVGSLPESLNPWLAEAKSRFTSRIQEQSRHSASLGSYGPIYAKGLNEWLDKLKILGNTAQYNLAVCQLGCSFCSFKATSICTAIRHLSSGYSARGQCEQMSREDLSENPRLFPDEGADDRPPFVVFALVSVSQLDVTKASADDMDALGLFYRCITCAETNGGVDCDATWRDCITKHDHTTTTHAKFEVLPSKGSLVDERLCWSCSHCSVHLEKSVSRADVISHIITEHEVADPKVPTDFFYWGD